MERVKGELVAWLANTAAEFALPQRRPVASAAAQGGADGVGADAARIRRRGLGAAAWLRMQHHSLNVNGWWRRGPWDSGGRPVFRNGAHVLFFRAPGNPRNTEDDSASGAAAATVDEGESGGTTAAADTKASSNTGYWVIDHELRQRGEGLSRSRGPQLRSPTVSDDGGWLTPIPFEPCPNLVVDVSPSKTSVTISLSRGAMPREARAAIEALGITGTYHQSASPPKIGGQPHYVLFESSAFLGRRHLIWGSKERRWLITPRCDESEGVIIRGVVIPHTVTAGNSLEHRTTAEIRAGVQIDYAFEARAAQGGNPTPVREQSLEVTIYSAREARKIFRRDAGEEDDEEEDDEGEAKDEDGLPRDSGVMATRLALGPDGDDGAGEEEDDDDFDGETAYAAAVDVLTFEDALLAAWANDNDEKQTQATDGGDEDEDTAGALRRQAHRRREELVPWGESNHECCVLARPSASAPALHVLSLRPPRLVRAMHPSLRTLLEANTLEPVSEDGSVPTLGGDLDLRAANCASLLAALTDVTRSGADAAARLGR